MYAAPSLTGRRSIFIQKALIKAYMRLNRNIIYTCKNSVPCKIYISRAKVAYF